MSSDRREERVTINKEFESFDQFIQEYVTNISRSGAFIRTDQPLPVGTEVNLRFTVIMDDIESIEGLGRAVVGVGDFHFGGTGGEVHQQPDLASEVRRRPSLQRSQVGAVHRHDVAEALEVRVVDLARALVRDAVAATLGRRDRARIRRFAGVERGRSAGIDAKVRREPAPLEAILQYGLGRGRPAYIAKADEKYADALHKRRKASLETTAPILVPEVLRRGAHGAGPNQIVMWGRGVGASGSLHFQP